MVSKKLPYDTNGLPYDVYMGDSRPQCTAIFDIWDVMSVVIRFFISRIISRRISRSKVSTFKNESWGITISPFTKIFSSAPSTSSSITAYFSSV